MQMVTRTHTHADTQTHTHGRPCAFVFRLAKPRRRRGAAPKGETAIYPRVNGLNWKGRGTLKSLRLGPKSLHRRLRKRHLVYTKRKTRDPHPRAPPFSKHEKEHSKSLSFGKGLSLFSDAGITKVWPALPHCQPLAPSAHYPPTAPNPTPAYPTSHFPSAATLPMQPAAFLRPVPPIPCPTNCLRSRPGAPPPHADIPKLTCLRPPPSSL